MILQAETKEVTKSQEFQTVNYGVSTENLPLLFQMLRTNLYSDIHGSIIREVVSNVVDSHTEANKKQAVGEVEWIEENRLLGVDNQLIIRDFGVGLSPDRMRNIYGNYLSSTKRGDNDSIGGFGLGSKVPFAYTDSFFVHTIFDGVQYKYLCYIDSTQLGAISLLDSGPTAKENGTEIKIPVKNKYDKQKFQDAIFRQLSYFRNIKYINFQAPANKLLFENEFCVIIEKAPYSDLHIVLGNVAYPIDFTTAGLDRWQDGVAGCNLGLKFKIGELQPTLSRESIFWNEEVKKKVHTRMAQARRTIKEEIEKDLASEADYGRWYACVTHQKSKSFPSQWAFSRIKTSATYNPVDGSGPLSIKSNIGEWFAGMNIRTVIPFNGYRGRRSKISTSKQPEYQASPSSLSDIINLPVYKIEGMLSARKALFLFKTNSGGFVVVNNVGLDSYTDLQLQAIAKPYYKQATLWRDKLPDFGSIVVPDNEFITTSDDDYKEAYRKLVAQRKLEGKFTAKVLNRMDSFTGKIEDAFDWNKFESKFEDHKTDLIIYGTQEESDKLKRVAAMLTYSKKFMGADEKFKNVMFLKIGQHYLKQFGLMQNAYNVINVLKMTTPINQDLANVVSAHKISKTLYHFSVLRDFTNINKTICTRFLNVEQFTKDNSEQRRWHEKGLFEEIVKLCTEAKVINKEMEAIFVLLEEYMSGVDLLKFVRFEPEAIEPIRDYLVLKGKQVDPKEIKEIGIVKTRQKLAEV